MKIGQRIQQLRKMKNLSQDALAEQLHVTRQTISNWENDKSYPDIDTLGAISAYFGLTLDELVYGEERVASEPVAQPVKPAKKGWCLGLGILGLVLLLGVLGISSYRSRQAAVSFVRSEEKTVEVKTTGKTVLATGYFTVQRAGKVRVRVTGESDSGKLTVLLLDQAQKPVYQIAGDQVKDRQSVSLSPQTYQFQLVANDATEKMVSFSYDVRIESQ